MASKAVPAEFFVKYGDSHTDYDALRLMHNQMHSAKCKCKEGDEDCLEELAVLTEMLADFWEGKGIDYKTLLP